MQAALFAQEIVPIMTLPPEERHTRLATLHTAITTAYQAAVRGLTAEQAARLVPLGTETRTLAQVVGHITEWERFMILGAGDILAGLQHPRMVTSLDGYVEPDGQTPAFTSIDAFNTYQAEKHAGWDWARLQAQALETAATLHTLFTHTDLITAARLERTLPFRKRLNDGTRIPNITMGWNLWLTLLDHEGVEHAADLGLGG